MQFHRKRATKVSRENLCDVAACKFARKNHVMQLQFWSSSEIAMHKYFCLRFGLSLRSGFLLRCGAAHDAKSIAIAGPSDANQPLRHECSSAFKLHLLRLFYGLSLSLSLSPPYHASNNYDLPEHFLPEFQERKGYINLRKNTRRVSLGHPAGQTGVYRPVSQGFPVNCYRKTDRKGHFSRDTGRVSQGHPAIQGVFRNFM